MVLYTDPDRRWDTCFVPKCGLMKVLDFSEDNDHEPDSNTEYTRASLDVGLLPESFTICSAFMVTAWNTKFSSAKIFELLDTCGMFSQFSSSKQVDWDKYRECAHVCSSRLHRIHSKAWPSFPCKADNGSVLPPPMDTCLSFGGLC